MLLCAYYIPPNIIKDAAQYVQSYAVEKPIKFSRDDQRLVRIIQNDTARNALQIRLLSNFVLEKTEDYWVLVKSRHPLGVGNDKFSTLADFEDVFTGAY